MTELVIRLPGEPIPQNQGKIGRWKAKDGREGATIRQPTKVRHYKLDLQEVMYRAAVDAGWPEELARLAGMEEDLGRKTFFGDQPLALSIVAVFSCPKSDYRKTKPVPRRPHTGRYGNLDNIIKPVADAGEGVLWLDDGQICKYYEPFEKWVGAQEEAPFIEIRVVPVAELRRRTFEGGDAHWPRADSVRSAERSTAEPFASDDAPAATGALINPPAQPALFEEERP